MRKYFRIIFVLIGLTIFVFLLKQITLTDIVGHLQTINWFYVSGGFLVYIFINIVRAERFFRLADKVVSRRRFLYIIGIQNFFSVLLPFRLGELSYVYLVHKENKVSIGKNLATLVASRVLDLLSVVSIFLVAFILVSRSIDFPIIFVWVGVIMLFLIIILFLSLIYRTEQWNKFIGKVVSKCGLSGNKIAIKLSAKLGEVILGFANLRSEHLLLSSLLMSTIIWFASFVGGYFLLLGVGIKIGFWPSIFSYAMPLFISLTPFMSFGGFGSYEGSLVFGLFLFGLTGPAVIADSLLIHIADLIFAMIFSGFVALFKNRLFSDSLLNKQLSH